MLLIIVTPENLAVVTRCQCVVVCVHVYARVCESSCSSSSSFPRISPSSLCVNVWLFACALACASTCARVWSLALSLACVNVIPENLGVVTRCQCVWDCACTCGYGCACASSSVRPTVRVGEGMRVYVPSCITSLSLGSRYRVNRVN